MNWVIIAITVLIFGLAHESSCQDENQIDAVRNPCPVPGRGEIIADTESMWFYWKCTLLFPKRVRCPMNTLFNSASGNCERTSFVCTEEGGSFPEPLDCRTYHSCFLKEDNTFFQLSRECPPGFNFNQETGRCKKGACSQPPTHQPPKDVYAVIDVGYTTAAPDGVIVDHVLTSNNEFPAVDIRAKKGDTLHVRVTNRITDENGLHPLTTVHWHGLLLGKGLAIYDGPEGITQCGIAYNKTMTYDIPLVQSGTFWWHSHAGTQYTEGLLGALIIEDNNDPYLDQYDHDNLVFTLGDWYHTPAIPNLAGYKSPEHLFPRPNSALINGAGTFPCRETTLPCIQKQPLVYDVIPGARYRIRVINVSTFWMFKFYIEGHSLEIIEVDGIMTKRAPCDYIVMSSGQRYSIIVTMNAESSAVNRDFTIHSINANGDVGGGSSASAILRYSGVYRNPEGATKKNSEAMAYEPVPLDERLLVPYDDSDVAPLTVDERVYLEVIENIIDDIHYLTFNNIIFETEGAPLLYRMINNKPINKEANPINITYGKTVEVELYNANGFPHPFHLHGHAFWVTASGPANSGKLHYPYPRPIKRDTVTVEGNATVVFRFKADNPGAWLFHCHINWHHLVGLAAVFIEGQEQTRTELFYPDWARELCYESGEMQPHL